MAKQIKSRKTPRTKPATKTARFNAADRAELAARVAKIHAAAFTIAHSAKATRKQSDDTEAPEVTP